MDAVIDTHCRITAWAQACHGRAVRQLVSLLSVIVSTDSGPFQERVSVLCKVVLRLPGAAGVGMNPRAPRRLERRRYEAEASLHGPHRVDI